MEPKEEGSQKQAKLRVGRTSFKIELMSGQDSTSNDIPSVDQDEGTLVPIKNSLSDHFGHRPDRNREVQSTIKANEVITRNLYKQTPRTPNNRDRERANHRAKC